MKIWLINHYAVPTRYYPLARPASFAKELIRQGHEVTIIAASTVHNSNINLIESNQRYKDDYVDGIHYVYIHCHGYRGNGLDRVLNMCEFAIKLPNVCKHYEKPDIIVATSMPPVSCAMGIHLAKKYKTKGIAEIADLWPESIVAYGITSKSNPVIWALYKLEKWIYKKSDAIIFTMEGGKDYIIEKGWDKSHGGPIDLNKVYHINNGVDLEVFDYNKEHYKVDDPDLDDTNTFKVVYTGSIRRVNNLKQIVDVAEILSKSNNDKIKFLIFGDGDEREQIEKEVSQKHLDNIEFKGKIKKEQIPYVLLKADLCLFHWESTPLIKYGASGNKSFEYLAAGKPILSNSVTGYDLIKKYQCGISKNIKSAEEYAECIVEISNLPKDDRIIYGQNARNAAENYDFKKLTNDLIEVIENIND